MKFPQEYNKHPHYCPLGCASLFTKLIGVFGHKTDFHRFLLYSFFFLFLLLALSTSPASSAVGFPLEKKTIFTVLLVKMHSGPWESFQKANYYYSICNYADHKFDILKNLFPWLLLQNIFEIKLILRAIILNFCGILFIKVFCFFFFSYKDLIMG